MFKNGTLTFESIKLNQKKELLINIDGVKIMLCFLVNNNVEYQSIFYVLFCSLFLFFALYLYKCLGLYLYFNYSTLSCFSYQSRKVQTRVLLVVQFWQPIKWSYLTPADSGFQNFRTYSKLGGTHRGTVTPPSSQDTLETSIAAKPFHCYELFKQPYC